MKRRATLRLSLLAAGTLAACSNGVYSQHKVYDGGLPTHFILAAGAPVPLVVRGNPFPGDSDGAAVASAFSAPRSFPQIKFSATPAVNAGYYVVLVFGERPVGSSDYCRTPDLPARPTPAGQTAIYSEFCLGQKLLSDARVSTERIETTQDPRFDKMMRALRLELFPPNDPEYRREGSGCAMPNPC